MAGNVARQGFDPMQAMYGGRNAFGMNGFNPYLMNPMMMYYSNQSPVDAANAKLHGHHGATSGMITGAGGGALAGAAGGAALGARFAPGALKVAAALAGAGIGAAVGALTGGVTGREVGAVRAVYNDAQDGILDGNEPFSAGVSGHA